MSNSKVSSIIGWILLTFAAAIYAYGIIIAITQSLAHSNKIPEPLDSIVSTIGAILLTNLGAVLGISVAKPQSALSRMTLISRPQTTNLAAPQAIIATDPATDRELIQFVAVVFYLAVLVACFVVWAVNTFRSGEPIPVVSVIEQNGKNLLGVIAAYVAFILGSK
jgi:disulfide bond formation protein DsbB